MCTFIKKLKSQKFSDVAEIFISFGRGDADVQ